MASPVTPERLTESKKLLTWDPTFYESSTNQNCLSLAESVALSAITENCLENLISDDITTSVPLRPGSLWNGLYLLTTSMLQISASVHPMNF